MDRKELTEAISLMYDAFIASPDADIPELRMLVHEAVKELLSQLEPQDISSRCN